MFSIQGCGPGSLRRKQLDTWRRRPTGRVCLLLPLLRPHIGNVKRLLNTALSVLGGTQTQLHGPPEGRFAVCHELSSSPHTAGPKLHRDVTREDLSFPLNRLSSLVDSRAPGPATPPTERLVKLRTARIDGDRVFYSLRFSIAPIFPMVPHEDTSYTHTVLLQHHTDSTQGTKTSRSRFHAGT